MPDISPDKLTRVKRLSSLFRRFNLRWQPQDHLSAHRQRDTISLLLNDFNNGGHHWLWETAAEGNVCYVSPQFSKVTGLDQNQILGKSFAAILAEAQPAMAWTYFSTQMKNQQDIEPTVLAVSLANKTHYWEMTARPTIESSGDIKGYRGVCRDVTAQHASEGQLLAAIATAESASAAKSQFLAVMSHELRTPINAITGFTEVLIADQDGTITPPARLSYLNTILASAKHLQLLINDILDATRMERGTFKITTQPTDAAALFEEAVTMCQGQAEIADVSLVLRLLDGVEIDCDMPRIKQVTLNLLTNAIKFSPAGGIINIEMRRGENHGLNLMISDAGVGINPADIQRIFDPFVQGENGANRRFNGVGLGLSIAQKIAKLHGGDVTLESQEGAGTTATLRLPPGRTKWPQHIHNNQRSVAA